MWPVALVFGVIGAALGSFLPVVVERGERSESYLVNRSYCNACKKPLRWWELIPVLSYIFLRGKCQRCHAVIPWRYVVFEALAGVVFFLVASQAAVSLFAPAYWLMLILVTFLLLLGFHDALYQTFPASLLYAALGIAALYATVSTLSYSTVLISSSAAWLSSPGGHGVTYLVGGLVGAGLLGLLAFPSGGTWMGYGDVILAAVLGLWLGYPFILIAVVIAFYLGAIVGVLFMLAKKPLKDHRIAFGPFLIAGAIITYVWGVPIYEAIMRWWGFA